MSLPTVSTIIHKILPHTDHDPGAGSAMAAKVCVCLAFFLTPVFVGWWTADIWESHKVLLLLVTVSAGWICFWMATLQRRAMTWHWTRPDWFVIGVLAATVFSTIASIRSWAAFFPFSSWFAETLPAVTAVVGLYVLTAQLFRQRHDQVIGWASLAAGIVVAMLMQLFQFSNWPLWPLGLPRQPLFSSISTSAAQLSLVAGLVGGLALLSWSLARERWAQVAFGGTLVIGWLVLLLVGQTVGWVVFALGMVMVVVVQAQQGAKANVRLIGVAVVLAVLGMVAQFTNLASYSSLRVFQEPQLDIRSSAVIANATIQDHPVFGSGPGTWFYDFVSVRPNSFNLTPYWNVRFAQASNLWWQLAATTGVVGLLAWIALFLVSLRWLWQQWRRDGHVFTLATMFIVVATLLASFFTTWSLVALVLLFASLGLTRSAAAPTLSPRPLHLGVGLGLAATVILIILWALPAIRVYASDIITQQALTAINRVEPITAVEKRLEQALRLNSRNHNAAALLANAYVVEMTLDLQRGDTSKAQTQTQRIADQLKYLQQLDPANPVGYEISNNILSSLTGIVGDVELQARDNFIILRRLEPSNPIHDVGYGQTLMIGRTKTLAQETVSDEDRQLAQRLLTEALAAYDQALQKKPDYFQAQLARAQALRASEQYNQALGEIGLLLRQYPNLAVLWLEQAENLSLLNQAEAAVSSYEQAVTLAPNDPTVYLAFAGHYQVAKDSAKAKEVLQRGLVAVPGDTQLQQALDSLK